MKLLILGGTIFLGRHIVETALQCGHTVTLFNRGQRNAELFPQLEKLRGDRRAENGLDALKGHTWDAVIDTCGYIPREVRASARLLADATERYIFISTESVYANFQQAGIDETYATSTLADETVEEVTGETYGPLKVLCEREAEAALPGRALLIRPGLIVGPHDPTDRFTYWPARVARGGEILTPQHAGYAVQFIDVRDLAAWTVSMAEQKQTGVFNADGPTLTLGEVLQTSQAQSQSAAQFVRVTEEFLAQNNVAPWSHMPLWIPESDADSAGFARMSIERARAAGLTHRPLADTVRETLAWAATRPADHAWRAGLSAEREAELLKLWREKA